MSNIKFSKPTGHSTSIDYVDPESNYIDVHIMALSEGLYIDMNGTEVDVTADTINNIKNTYNASVSQTYAEDKILTPDMEPLNQFDNRQAPNQLDHDDSTVRKTVGHIIGFMDTQVINGTTHLFLKLRVKGRDNVECVRTKLWRNVSVQYNPTNYEFAEISWVVKGADKAARALFGKNEDSNNEMSETFKNTIAIMRTKQHLIEETECALSKLRDHYAARKYLVALCKTGKLNKARATNIEKELHKFSNPVDVVTLLGKYLPVDKFIPTTVNDDELIVKLLKGEQMENTNNNSLTIADVLSNIKLKAAKSVKAGIDTSDIEKDTVLGGNPEYMAKHKKLLQMRDDAMDSDDVEMAKKYHGLARKLAEEAEKGDVNLSEYEVDEETKDSKELKKLSAQIEELTIKFNEVKKSNNDITELNNVLQSNLKLSTEKISEREKLIEAQIEEIKGIKSQILTEVTNSLSEGTK